MEEYLAITLKESYLFFMCFTLATQKPVNKLVLGWKKITKNLRVTNQVKREIRTIKLKVVMEVLAAIKMSLIMIYYRYP